MRVGARDGWWWCWREDFPGSARGARADAGWAWSELRGLESCNVHPRLTHTHRELTYTVGTLIHIIECNNVDMATSLDVEVPTEDPLLTAYSNQLKLTLYPEQYLEILQSISKQGRRVSFISKLKGSIQWQILPSVAA